MKWFFLLLGLSAHLCADSFDKVTPSTPDEIASLSADLVVNGFVSAISGQLSLTEVDLHVKGAQDLVLKRTYVPPQILGRYEDKNARNKLALCKALLQLNTKGWVVLPHLWAGYNPNSPYFQVRDPQGYVLEFQIQANRGILKTPSYGCSNLRSGEPSSSADIRNIELWAEDNQVRIIWPNGVQRVYIHQRAGRYRLDLELLPNGRAIRYQHHDKGFMRIASTDVSGQYIYASIDKVGAHQYRASDTRGVQLTYELREIKGEKHKKRKKHTQKASRYFPVMTHSCSPIYSNSIGYNDRTLLTSYDAESYPISCSYFQQKGVASRIQTFSTPSGSISFSYDPPIAGQKGGSTTVSYPDGAIVIYCFNSSLLLTSLENWLEGKLYNQKVFSYDHKQHIAQIETKDGQGNTLLTKTYECDASGNPTLETHSGDFGTFTIRRIFSKNRLVSESRDDGLDFEYAYLGDTHLITAKITLANGQPIRRTLYTYDEANNLIEEREEGQTVTTYHLYKQGSHLHRLHIKEEKDWDGNLILKTQYSYDRFGNTTEEAHYGSDGKFAYSIQRTYDEKGNLLEEVNPLGQKASYIYDKRNRPIKEIPFSNRLTIDRTFDEKGRLTLLKAGDHKTHFVYNASDELTQKIDYLGLTTNYTYHPVHNKPVLIETDPIHQEIAYDPFGRETERKDAYGASKKIKHNSYSDPLEITHPDGGKETFSYAVNGLLLEEIDPDSLKTRYSYDPLGRMLSKRVGDYETVYKYDAYHLIEEKDPLGISTLYTYNLAGQKIKEEREGRVTEFSYDSLGFLAHETKSGRVVSFQNDVLGRVLEKDIDGVLKTAYTYDPAGNIASVSKGDPTYFSYDPYDRLVEKIDAEGAKTTTFYEEGDQVLIKRIEDPRDIEIIEAYNAHELLLRRKIPGVTLEEFSYDRALRLISQDHLTFTYTPEGFRSSMCEAGKRTTYWTYTPGGKVQSKQKPDGSVLQYEYNSQGELVRVGSREFGYDALGRLIQGSGFQRELDPFGNIIKEELSNSLAIESLYDDWDRPIKRVLPDQSQILYEYDGPLPKTITRINRHGSTYSHSYESFDCRGNPLTETGLFTTTYSYDKSGRRTFQKSPYFEEHLTYDLVGNLTQKGFNHYTYDNASQLIAEKGKFTTSYDQHYNCIQKNGKKIPIDDLNQRRDVSYDLSGNLIRPGFVYDAFDQLTQAESELFFYDALGRRILSGSTSYFYINEEEIGSFEKGQIKELKVLGSTAPIAIEIDEKPFAPTVDVQGTTRQLVDWKTGELFAQNTCDAFGYGITNTIPYAYVGKRYDPKTALIYFGKRFYDPRLRRWLTQDPLGPLDHSNLYQYVFNNPYRFLDPNGENILGFLCGIGQILAGGAIMATGVALEVATFGGYTFALGFHEAAGLSLMASGCTIAMYNAKDLSFEKRSSRPDPDIRAEGNPHTIIQVPGPAGSYTTHNEDGSYKQYRGSGKSHSNIPRPNVKETKNHPSPSGPKPGKPKVREPTPDEIPKKP